MYCIALSLTIVSLMFVIIGAVCWNKKRLSLCRLSVSAVGLLYAVFAMMYLLRFMEFLPVRAEVMTSIGNVNSAIEQSTLLLPWLSVGMVTFIVNISIVLVDIGVALIAIALGRGWQIKWNVWRVLAIVLVAILSLPVLFPLCCMIMSLGGYAFNLSYREYCVIGNNYGQAATLVWSAFCVFICSIRYKLASKRRTTHAIAITCMSALYFVCYVIAFHLMCVHYDMPLNDAYSLTVQELQLAGEKSGMGYIGINLLIYVFGFVGLIFINCGLASLIKRSSR